MAKILKNKQKKEKINLKQQLMLRRMWNKGNTLVGVQTCTTALEVTLVVFQKAGNRSTSGHSSGAYTQKNHHHTTRHLLNYVQSSFIHNSHRWKQPTCPSTEDCIKTMWFIYTME